jgi:eukaryotic-like serine/threonine-protein kinase
MGILFFEMLTGQLPFRSNDRETLLEMQRSAPAPRPRSLREDISPTAEAIILKLLEKDQAKRFRDAHHLKEELKAFQRTLPQTSWEIDQPDAPAAPPPPPPAPTPGVQEWGTRAANFARMVARGYPNGRTPPEIQAAANKLWELAARASRLEGELSTHSRKLQAIERRGRALRAEIGRKVEELAADESRALREAAAERDRASKYRTAMQTAQTNYQQASKRAGGAITDAHQAREVYEAVGVAKATVEGYRRQVEEHEAVASSIEERAANLRRQIDDLRAQLQRYSDALENDLATGRDKIATRVREALGYEQSFAESSTLLMTHLKDRPECRDLVEELAARDRDKSRATPSSYQND